MSFAELQITTQENEIIVEMSPRNPEPYKDVNINISSYATDLNKAIITWQGDKGILLSGIGKTSYSFKTLGPNTSMTISVLIKPVGSVNTINKRIVINPSEIDLLWEAVDGYTPPFYKGKTLSSKGGLIKVVAIPNSDTIKKGGGNISYIWKNNDEVKPDSSGYNKNSYTFRGDVYSNDNNVTVIASSVDGNYSAEKIIDIQRYLPRVIFYKKSPTEGVLYNNAFSEKTTFDEEELTLVAEPYNLAIKNKGGDFNYAWNINGDRIDTPSKPLELTVRPTSRGGYADVSIVVEGMNELFQKVIGRLKLSL